MSMKQAIHNLCACQRHVVRHKLDLQMILNIHLSRYIPFLVHFSFHPSHHGHCHLFGPHLQLLSLGMKSSIIPGLPLQPSLKVWRSHFLLADLDILNAGVQTEQEIKTMNHRSQWTLESSIFQCSILRPAQV